MTDRVVSSFIASMAGSTIIDVVYGMDVGSDGASYFKVVEKAAHMLSDIGNVSYLGVSTRP
jgi:hypothetical protein